jgi:hypothetical protein
MKLTIEILKLFGETVIARLLLFRLGLATVSAC